MANERSRRHNPIIPELRRLHSPDVLDLHSSGPEESDDFCILVQAMIGPAGEPGEESFDFVVCTPKWLRRHLSDRGFVFGRHYLIVDRYDSQIIENAISSLCQTITGSSWQEVADRLERYGKWEFEDYYDTPKQV